MPAAIDITGQRFGKWLTIEQAESLVNPCGTKARTYKCICDCGTESVVRSSDLRGGASTNCGCVRKKRVSERNTKHGMSNSKEHKAWRHMLGRCRNPNDQNYDRYGGRGIKVCDRWDDFANFYEDVGTIAPGLEVDRIDNDGNYEPGNVRLATRRENILNSTVVTPVIQFDRSGNEIARYNTINEAAAAVGISRQHITSITMGRGKTAGGFIWKRA